MKFVFKICPSHSEIGKFVNSLIIIFPFVPVTTGLQIRIDGYFFIWVVLNTLKRGGVVKLLGLATLIESQ